MSIAIGSADENGGRSPSSNPGQQHRAQSQAFLRNIVAWFRFGFGKGIKQVQEERQARVNEHALFAEDLGAEVIRRTSNDIASALAEIAEAHHITQIVLGQPAHNRWEVFFLGSVTNRVLRLNSDVDIHLVPLHRNESKEHTHDMAYNYTQ